MKKMSNIELKREYWSHPDMFFTPKMVDALVREYGEKPATFLEGVYVINYHLLYIMSQIPFLGRLVK